MKTVLILCWLALLAHLPTAADVPPGQRLWEFQTGGGMSSPAIGVDGTVYVGSNDGKVYALNGSTGQKLWEFQTGGPTGSSPAVGPDERLYIGSSDAYVYALNAVTGQEIWKFAVAPWVSSSPALGVNGVVYVGSGRAADNNNIYALNGATGEKVWEFHAGFGQSGSSSPALAADGTVYVGAVAKVYAFNGATGEKVWEFSADGFVESSPAIGADGTIYVGSNGGKVYALNGATGQKVWEFSNGFGLPVACSPVIGSDGTVYIGSYEGAVYALNGTTGQERWEFHTGLFVLSSGAIAADGTLYVGSNDGKLYALNSASGEKVWEFQTGGPVSSSPAIGVDGTVYVGSSDGKLYALQGTASLAQSPWPKFRHNLQNTGQGTKQAGIEKQPTVAVLKEGQEGRIAVQVSGLPAPQVQWFFNGTAIPGGTNPVLNLPRVSRFLEGTYWLTASNALGRATSAPIAALVSNVDPDQYVNLRWPGRVDGNLTLESTDLLGPSAAWRLLSNYPPSPGEQSWVEVSMAAAGFYRLNGSGAVPSFTGAGRINGWQFDGPVGTQYRIEVASASSRWTNWVILTNLVLAARPYLFLDYESFGEPKRVYRTTTIP